MNDTNNNNNKKHTEQIQLMQRLHGDVILDEGGFFKKISQKDQALNKEAAVTYYSNWRIQSNNNNGIYYDEQEKIQQVLVEEEQEQDTVIINKEEKFVQRRREQAQNMTNAFYDLVTDFYEYGKYNCCTIQSIFIVSNTGRLY